MPQKLRESRVPELTEPTSDARMREGAKLLGHREASLPEAALGGRDLDVEWVGESGVGLRVSPPR